MERHRLLEASHELPEPFSELRAALVLEKPSVHPGHGKTPDVVERRRDERGDVRLPEGAPERNPLRQGRLSHDTPSALPVLRYGPCGNWGARLRAAALRYPP